MITFDSERVLVWLLRIEAVIAFCAMPVIVMPTNWMAAIHTLLGLGELPRSPIVEYLTRSISMLYVGWAPILWVMSNDIHRYLPLIWTFGWLSFAAGWLFLLLDLFAGMPILWTIVEVGFVLGFSVLTLWFTWNIQKSTKIV